MKCPSCNSESIAPDVRSVAIERLDGPWRHFHAQCMNCGEHLWWNAHPGDDEPSTRAGVHECAFFKPAES